MRIRLMDTPDQVEAVAAVLRHAFDVVEESDEYANRGTSRMVRRYVDLRLRPKDAELDAAVRRLRKTAAHRLVTGRRWRVVITDSESADGIMPVCASPEHPVDDRGQQWSVYDCCDPHLIETYCEALAAFLVAALNDVPTLLAAVQYHGAGGAA
ncbi:hypothetical protein KGQ20_39480 [Catenulispora sp. NF23]|uniref:hypothetical protein n=1 Tax=Catenulispora pinistramenti TaxID=2705254 RepID=UPI001BAD3CDA|nr:hypothetical protein [Catenulispora pinistramenti]MBS2538846.1 hypothetical protein [Catenulispora pinistramenti]